jgi:hypothetical protein
LTKFEKRGIQEGREIYDIMYHKLWGHCLRAHHK